MGIARRHLGVCGAEGRVRNRDFQIGLRSQLLTSSSPKLRYSTISTILQIESLDCHCIATYGLRFGCELRLDPGQLSVSYAPPMQR